MNAPLDYRGTRHARLTKSMKNLPGNALKLLSELRYSIADGQTSIISNALLAHRTGLSEGYVSECIRWLAGETNARFTRALPFPFITRTRRENAPGFAITMLPPPEQRTRAAAPPTPTPCPQTDESNLGDHGDDPLPEMPASAAQCVKTVESRDHGDDPPILLDTCTQQQQDRASVQNNSDRPSEVWTDELWAEMKAGTKGYTKAAFYADMAIFLNRPGYGIGAIIEARRNGQPIWSREDIDHGRTKRPSASARVGIKPDAHTGRSASGQHASRRSVDVPDDPATITAKRSAWDALPLIDLTEFGLSM